ncbi:MAG: T9SS type A sorting domain-containing protein, partial [Nitrosopumilaceae archaeon]
KTPTSFSLEQNYPNPFNPGTTIQFSLPRSGYVTLKVYNTLGAEVATLVAENLSAGRHAVEWNANGLAGGV